MEEIVRRELRLDLSQGNLDTRRRTPQGGLIVDANISRVGVFSYANADGSERRELRTPDEVFSKRALDSFAHAPLTVEHPAGLVTPETWKQVTVGHVAGPAVKDGKFVGAELHIQDKATIDRIERGELVELSCGYQCRLDTTPGEHPEFGEYDAKQTEILGNHVAMGPKNWGRAGPEVKMHLDGGVGVSGVDASYVRATMAAAKKNEGAGAGAGAGAGETVEGESSVRSDERERELEGELAGLKAENERLRKADRERNDAAAREKEQARIDAAISARIDLLSVASPILTKEGERAYRGDGKTDHEIRLAVLEVLEPEMKLDAGDRKDEAFVRGAFKSAVARADRVRGGWKELGDVLRPEGRENATGGGTNRADGKRDGEEEEETVEDAQKRMVDRQRDAYRAKDKRDRGTRDRGSKDKRDRGRR